MLFNSYFFIFIFLPVTLIGFHLIGSRGHHRIAISWLVGMSLFFYGWWNPAYLGLILSSILFNYAFGISLLGKPSKVALTIGVAVNIIALGYFKYANFFIDNLNILVGSNLIFEQIILPLAISFFTFQQIAYLIDAYRGETKEYDFLQYCLFVTFFPQLIAGPIVHHKEMLPQFLKDTLYKIKAEHLAIGLTIFIIGLFKKVVIADGIAEYSTPVFAAAELGVRLTIFEAWGGALAYTFQLYFDFSGYSEMAIGLARMFGVTLPINFFSPYKANNIIEFWRRWHITLSRFLRDYIYIPIGGNRKGSVRRYTNIMITMLLGGLWHGAGWTFVAWGGMHGIYLIVNHGWIALKYKVFPHSFESHTFIGMFIGRLLTFVAVVVAWVMFRADTLDGATTMYLGMFGGNGISLPAVFSSTYNIPGWISESLNFVYDGMYSNAVFIEPKSGVSFLVVLMLWVWFAPNTIEWLQNYKPVCDLKQFKLLRLNKLQWKASVTHAVIILVIAVWSVMKIQGVSEFLYFRF